MLLSKKKRYLQIALNSTMEETYQIIQSLPVNDRIIVEAGTPLIKEFGAEAIRKLYDWWGDKTHPQNVFPYIVADLKTMDRGETEVRIAKNAGASAVICLGQAPVETINSFVESCEKNELDSMIDMMNIPYPNQVLRKLKHLPDVVLLHRGVDEEKFNKDKPIPYIQINKVLSAYNVLISIAGGDTIREVQRAVFNGANIVVVWKEFYHSGTSTGELAEAFLKEIK